MNRRILITVLCLIPALLEVQAQNPDTTGRISPSTFRIMEVLNPWLATTNPAGMRYNPGVDIGDLTLNYHQEQGDYRKVQEGDSLNSYFLSTTSFKRINKTWFFGNFQYKKSYEKNCNYNLVNNPYRHTPYLLIDTMARNDIYDREFFDLRGDLSTPLARWLSYGLSVHMDVGLSSQDRDPRPRNKVMNLDVSQGLLFAGKHTSMGLNMLYSYYNEDIEAEVIEENVQLAFFQLHGFNAYTYHVASSFNRLYQRNTFGGEGQLGFSQGGWHGVFGARFLYMDEMVGDGRKAGDASWSYIKDDSQLLGNLISAFSSNTFSHGQFHHLLKAAYTAQHMVGAEFLQRLEQVGEAGAVDWVDYGKEEKYASQRNNLDFQYTFLMAREQVLPELEIGMELSYQQQGQSYYLPDMHESIRNRTMGMSARKSFYPGNHEFSVGAGLRYRKNLSAVLDMDYENFISEKLIRPDFIYHTGDVRNWWINAGWAIRLNRHFEKYFVGLNLGSMQFGDAAERKSFHLNTGLIF